MGKEKKPKPWRVRYVGYLKDELAKHFEDPENVPPFLVYLLTCPNDEFNNYIIELDKRRESEERLKALVQSQN